MSPLKPIETISSRSTHIYTLFSSMEAAISVCDFLLWLVVLYVKLPTHKMQSQWNASVHPRVNESIEGHSYTIKDCIESL